MKIVQEIQIRKRIKAITLFFIISLALSGITAFPLEWELAQLVKLTKDSNTIFSQWFIKVYNGLITTNEKFPFISYGSDWLAFAHLVIAIAFIGPLKDPVKNRWLFEFGMIACVMILPTAFICGFQRGIPLFWILIDCSFGVFGFIPLCYCYLLTKKLENISQTN